MNVSNKGIISRSPGPMGIMPSDIKRVFSELWKKSPGVIKCLGAVKAREIEPEEAVEMLFESGTEDQILWCFLVLVSLNNEDAVLVIQDLSDHSFNSVDDAYDDFLMIYKKERVCSGRHASGRKKPRTTA